jgi:hypothetical protein
VTPAGVLYAPLEPEEGMLRLASLLCIFVTAFPTFGQSASKYQVGTITEVKVHQTAGTGASDAASYDVSVKVGDTIYVVHRWARKP